MVAAAAGRGLGGTESSLQPATSTDSVHRPGAFRSDRGSLPNIATLCETTDPAVAGLPVPIFGFLRVKGGRLAVADDGSGRSTTSHSGRKANQQTTALQDTTQTTAAAPHSTGLFFFQQTNSVQATWHQRDGNGCDGRRWNSFSASRTALSLSLSVSIADDVGQIDTEHRHPPPVTQPFTRNRVTHTHTETYSRPAEWTRLWGWRRSLLCVCVSLSGCRSVRQREKERERASERGRESSMPIELGLPAPEMASVTRKYPIKSRRPGRKQLPANLARTRAELVRRERRWLAQEKRSQLGRLSIGAHNGRSGSGGVGEGRADSKTTAQSAASRVVCFRSTTKTVEMTTNRGVVCCSGRHSDKTLPRPFRWLEHAVASLSARAPFPTEVLFKFVPLSGLRRCANSG